MSESVTAHENAVRAARLAYEARATDSNRIALEKASKALRMAKLDAWGFPCPQCHGSGAVGDEDVIGFATLQCPTCNGELKVFPHIHDKYVRKIREAR